MDTDRILKRVIIEGTDPRFPDYKTRTEVIFYRGGAIAFANVDGGESFIYLYKDAVREFKKLLAGKKTRKIQILLHRL